MPLHAQRMGGFRHLASPTPSFLDPPHPFDGGYEHTSPLDLSFSHHGGCVETHHVETSLNVALTDEISLCHAFHDETPHEETSRNMTFPDASHLEDPHGKTYRGALHYGSSGGFLGLCSRYLIDHD
jgi:hypothetical protein